MDVRAEMNLIGEKGLIAAGDVFIDEMIVIHQVKMITTRPDENGKTKEVVVMPSKKRGEDWDRIVNIKSPEVYKKIEDAVIASIRFAIEKDERETPLSVDIRLYENGETRGYATLTYADVVQIDGIRIYEREGTLKVGFPYEKRGDYWQNLAGPATVFVKDRMEQAVFAAYDAKVREKEIQAVAHTEESPFADEAPDKQEEKAQEQPEKRRGR